MRHILIALTLLVGGLMGSQELCAVPAQVIVVRHGEKPPRGNSLSQQGRERSAALTYYILETPELMMFGQPVAIFASKPASVNSSLREIQTVTPLANALKQSIYSPFTSKQVDEVAHMILEDKLFQGKTVVICWEHFLIPDLIYALGVNRRTQNYPNNRYDLTWVLTYTDPTHPTLQVYLQKLMFGDSSEPFNPFAPSK